MMKSRSRARANDQTRGANLVVSALDSGIMLSSVFRVLTYVKYCLSLAVTDHSANLNTGLNGRGFGRHYPGKSQ